MTQGPVTLPRGLGCGPTGRVGGRAVGNQFCQKPETKKQWFDFSVALPPALEAWCCELGFGGVCGVGTRGRQGILVYAVKNKQV